MKDLISFELNKIFSKKVCIYIIIAAVLMNLFIFFMTDLTKESYSILDREYKGIEAIAKEKAIVKEFAGELTDEKIANIHKQVSLILDNSENYDNQIDEITLKETVDRMEQVGRKDHEIEDTYKSFKLKDEIKYREFEKYYTIHELINRKFTSADGEQIPIAKVFPDLEKPLQYDYHKGWDCLIRTLSNLINFLLCLITIVCISPLFAEEYSLGADAIILTTQYGKNKVVSAKIISAILFSTTIFVGFALLNTCLYGLTYGFSGGEVSILFDGRYSKSGYNITYFQLYIVTLVLGLLGTLFLTAITLFFSSKVRTAFSCIIFAALLAFIPSINVEFISTTAQKIMDLMPLNIMNVVDIFKRPIDYDIFGINVFQPYVMLVVAIIGSAILIPLAYRGFSRHQV